jgi:hypothetical protein
LITSVLLFQIIEIVIAFSLVSWMEEVVKFVATRKSPKKQDVNAGFLAILVVSASLVTQFESSYVGKHLLSFYNI